MSEVTVVVWPGPHTEQLESHAELAGVRLSFPKIAPIHVAFDAMVREQSYDISEMAIATFLQAHAVGKPLVLLPLAMAGGFHHRSLYVAPEPQVSSPAELVGRRVGVRSYSQTTGLWVRGWLQEEFGVGAGDVEWIVTEGSHLAEFHDPDNVILTDEPVAAAVQSGSTAAAILGLSDATELESLLPDHRARARAWYDRHGFTPINHVAVVTTDLLEQNEELVRAVYAELAAGIDKAEAEPAKPGEDGIVLPQARRHGVQAVRPAIELAARYAYEQGLIESPIEDLGTLFAFDPRT